MLQYANQIKQLPLLYSLECSQSYLRISLAYCCFMITIEISFHTPVYKTQWFIPIWNNNSYFYQQISPLIFSLAKDLFCNLLTISVALILLLTKLWDPLKSKAMRIFLTWSKLAVWPQMNLFLPYSHLIPLL